MITTETVRHCPHCGNTIFTKDYKREETYCNKCGLVLQSAFQYMGLEKVENVIPFSAPSEARDGVHLRWHTRQEWGKVNNRKNTVYRHNISDRKLMKFGG